MNILVTNDDGVSSPGIFALSESMQSISKTYILAPDHNWSLTGHVKTINRPLRIKPVELWDKSTAWSTDGSPSDCVTLASQGFFGVPFDMVVSGINTTANLAQDVTCSGTVSAAIEAAIYGIPAIAFSLESSTVPDYHSAAIWAKNIVEIALQHNFAPNSFLNVNIPALPASEIKGIQITRLGTRIYYDAVEKRQDPRGYSYYWICGSEPGGELQAGTDIGTLAEGYISITPVHLDMTAYHWMQDLEAWNWNKEEPCEINLPLFHSECC
jgi:5'-nucleotidase